MKAQLTVYTEEDFNRWIATTEKIALNTNDPSDKNLSWGWKWEK